MVKSKFLIDHPECGLRTYRSMLAARFVDEAEASYVKRGEAFFHVSGAGHEGLAALAPFLIPADWLHLHYRDKSLMLARGLAPKVFFESLFCKDSSHSKGRQMSAHISSPQHKILSLVGPVGNNALQAVGVAAAIRDQAERPLVICAIGDGGSQQGEVLESIAHAVRAQLPVLFLIEDNRYSISTVTERQTFFSGPNGPFESFYGMPILRIDGRAPSATFDLFQSEVQRVRESRAPALVVFDVDRLNNHTNADDQTSYRSPSEIESGWAAGDPIRNMRAELLASGVAEEELVELENDVRLEIEAAAEEAQAGADPQPVFTAKAELPTDLLEAKENRGNETEPRVTMLEAIRGVLEQQLANDPRVTLFGEDIADPKGDVFGATRGLTKKFPGRVINSPLSESTIVGVSIGRALAGERPVAFLQFADFLPLAFNQIFAELGSMHWRSAGGWSCPVIIMATCGGYRPGLGPFHASSMESIAAHTPGVDVFMPSSAGDAAGLLNAAFRSGRPTIFFYPKSCLNDRSETTSANLNEQLVPIGKGRVVRAGNHLTLVGWGNAVSLCRSVASTLSSVGAECELIDLRSLEPWDAELVAESAAKTGHLIVVHEDTRNCGIGAEIIATISERLGANVKVGRVTRADTYVPCNFANQLEVLPSYKTILEAAAEMLDFDLKWVKAARTGDDGIVTVEAIGSSPSDETVRIVEFCVEPGQSVKAGDRLATVEADKAAVDTESPISGEVVALLGKPGDSLKVGAPLLQIRSSGKRNRKPVVALDPGMPTLVRKVKPGARAALQPETIGASGQSAPVIISSVASCLGAQEISNEQVAASLKGVSAEQILQQTGIASRRWISKEQSALTLAIAAARGALKRNGLTINDVDLVICCCGTSELVTPSMACLVLNALAPDGVRRRVAAYDINAACSGYLYALQSAYDYLQARPGQRVLLVTAETLSRRIDQSDPDTAPIFADAATASVLSTKVEGTSGHFVLSRPILWAKGEDGSVLCVPAGSEGNGRIKMKGRKVFQEAVRTMIELLSEACAYEKLSLADLKLVVAHQANQRIIDAIQRRIDVPEERVFSNIGKIGNTSSSSIPLCLEEILNSRGDPGHIGLCAFGGGFTGGGAIIKYER